MRATLNPFTGDIELVTPPSTPVAPGGNNTDIQFNNSGVFGGSDNLTWNNTNNKLTVNTPTTTDAAANVMMAPSGTAKKTLVIQSIASQSVNILEVQKYDGTVLMSYPPTGADRDSNGAMIIGGEYPNHINQVIIKYFDDSAASEGLYLKNVGTGSGIILHATAGTPNALYITQADGSAGALQIGAISNPADGSQLIASYGIWYLNGGAGAQFSVNGTPSSNIQLNANIYASTYKGLVIKGAASQSANLAEFQNNSSVPLFAIDPTGNVATYKQIATAGNGVPSIYGYGRSTAQTGAVASVATYTVGSSDSSFIISANANITAFVAGTFNVTVAYTDETNTAQTLKLNFSSLTGTLGIALAASGPFEGIPAHIRCKASTSITIATVGTFTSLTYNVEGTISQIA